MKRILVIQLGRMGDVLMTGPMLRDLRREHPSAEISLMVIDGFAATPLPPRLYDRLVPFPPEGLTRTLVERQAGWAPALDELRTFVKSCTSAAFDLAVNLDHTETSGLLMSVLPSQKRAGFVLRPNRRRAIEGPWMTYLRAAVRSREFTAFHLVDLFSWTAGVPRDSGGLEIDITAGDQAWADEFLATHGLSDRPIIAMMLGASTEAKRWPAERFAALADALDPALGEILLIGGKKEHALAQTFLAAVKRPVIDSTGCATLGGLAALLRRSRLVVTNDTGPMHVATAAGTRVMDISSGPVSAYETGPYGIDHVVVEPELSCFPCPLDSECHHYDCRFSLSTDDAAAVARFAMGLGPAPTLRGARMLRSHRSTSSGRIEFVPVGSAPTATDGVRMAAAEIWERTLGAPPRAGDGWVGEPAAASLTHLDPARLAAIREHLHEVTREATAAAAALRSVPSAPPMKRQALADGAHARLERMLALGESDRAVHAVVTFLLNEIDSASGDVLAMARAQVVAYNATAARAGLLADRLGC